MVDDLEALMDDIETVMKANLQTYITAANTKKGDSLLAAFDSASYLKYHLPGVGIMSPYPVSFLQYVNKVMIGDSNHQEVSTTYDISIDCIVSCSAASGVDDEKKLDRYHQVLKKVLIEKVIPRYTGAMLTDASVVFGVEGSGRTVGITQWCLSVSLV